MAVVSPPAVVVSKPLVVTKAAVPASPFYSRCAVHPCLRRCSAHAHRPTRFRLRCRRGCSRKDCWLARRLRHGGARRPKAEESRPKVEELPDEIAPAAAEEPPISMAEVMQMMKVPRHAVGLHMHGYGWNA